MHISEAAKAHLEINCGEVWGDVDGEEIWQSIDFVELAMEQEGPAGQVLRAIVDTHD